MTEPSKGWTAGTQEDTATMPLDRFLQLVESNKRLAEALRALTGTIRSLKNVYGDKTAGWMMDKESFKAAERLLEEVGG